MTNPNEWEKMTWQEQLRQLLINAKCDLGHANQGSIETFVRNLLSRHDKERMEEVVGMVRKKRAEVWRFYHEAELWEEQAEAVKPLDDILTTLRSPEGEEEKG